MKVSSQMQNLIILRNLKAKNNPVNKQRGPCRQSKAILALVLLPQLIKFPILSDIEHEDTLQTIASGTKRIPVKSLK